MQLDKVGPGKSVPDEINVIIEIPTLSPPVKYEVGKESGAFMVDRFLPVAMHYPCNYGYIPNTLSDDGDPSDVLVITPYPLIPGCVISCRPIGILKMTDEKGVDAKLLAVPTTNLSAIYEDIKTYKDVSVHIRDSIAHFFEHYKDLEKEKWVKLEGWAGPEEAKKEILHSVERYQVSHNP